MMTTVDPALEQMAVYQVPLESEHESGLISL